MRTPTSLALAASLFTLSAVPALSLGLAAKPPTSAADIKAPDNAALAYMRAWLLLGPDISQKFQDVVKSDADWAPDAEITKILEDNQDHIRSLMAASRAPTCDFGVDYAQGFQALMPHLGYLRRDSRMLTADAVRLASKGDATGAAERLASMFRMSNQCGQDGILISSLVGAAICNSAVSRTGILLDQKKLNPQAARVLLDAARSIDKDDPFGVRASIAVEGLVLVETVKKTYTGPKAGAEFIAVMTRNGTDDDLSARAKVSAMNGEQLATAVLQASGYYTDSVAVWNAPDAHDKLDKIQETRDKYGPMAPLVAPSLTKSRNTQAKIKESLDQLIARLEAAAK